MSKLIINLPNIPYGPAEDIDEPTWHRIKVNFPAEYAQAQKEIKAHEAAHPAEAEADKAEVTSAPAKSAGKGV
jgi:hypothetical protein